MQIATLAGGVGAAKMLNGLCAAFDHDNIVAIVNVADDERLHGLHISPDLDTVTYTLAQAIDVERGWGLSGESWTAMASVGRYAEHTGRDDIGWFQLGDQDLGTHMFRTTRLAEGATLTEVTAEIAGAWGVPARLLPVTDDRVATRVTTVEHGELAFQDYFVRLHHDVAASGIAFAGAESARPGPHVLAALASADVVVIAPSNPIVSIGPVLAVPGVADAVRARRDDTVAVSPIVGGRALKGPADRLMAELGHEVSVVGVARIYAEFAATLVVDELDRALAPAVEAVGVRCVVTPTVMSNRARAADLARVVVEAGILSAGA
jgi:LPPG:FO 2-phospho-L-lactate transferase